MFSLKCESERESMKLKGYIYRKGRDGGRERRIVGGWTRSKCVICMCEVTMKLITLYN
jgi:hypothetical protein